MKLLCCADLHLGRQPSRLPEGLAPSVRAAELGPAAAWRRTVAEARQLSVDAVLLAGDVVDDDSDFFEAYADLRSGAEELADAGIRVLAVSGNHDVRVLPRLAEAVSGVTLLGRDGRWQAETLTGADGVQAHILGWSFPHDTAPGDPLADGLPPREDALPVIGLLHADRDATGSPYAPVRSADLRAAPVDAWLLGHLHAPDLAPGPRPMGYLGSLVGTDPGEPGPHGPWLLEVTQDGTLSVTHLPLAPLRWEEVPIDVSELAAPEQVHVRIAAALDALDRRVASGTHPPRAVGCRLRLGGRTGYRREVQRLLEGDDPRRSVQHRGDVAYFVHAWHLDALPEVDLHALAQGSDPVGLLAARLLLLREGTDDPARQALIQEARPHLRSVRESRYLRDVGTEPLDDERIAELLDAAALRALDVLLAQREDLAS
ncbi:MAG: metallophosphoesterase [Trueperaceae bacterium]|nr:metallophosphoesterase [Trueperaceae bacterium]